jgi:hypothetical protein
MRFRLTNMISSNDNSSWPVTVAVVAPTQISLFPLTGPLQHHLGLDRDEHDSAELGIAPYSIRAIR